jgi:phage FluMu gp28-like protein
LDDHSPLKIIEKSRQIGLTYVDAYDSVLKASRFTKPASVYVSSRDLVTTRLYLEQCIFWARFLKVAAENIGEQIIEDEKRLTALVLRFATGCCIYSLSSHPNALVGKHGHIKLDEFAAHENQRMLYRYAMPCTTWGYQLSILSTHRGRDSVFNQIITEITQKQNPMRWSHYRVTIHDAIAQGLVEKINEKSGRNDSHDDFLANLRAKCIDEEQWLQEFCCVPADESSAFITYDMLHACESPGCMKPPSYLFSGCAGDSAADSSHSSNNPTILSSRSFYVGVDVARKDHLCVIDVGERIGDVVWDRLRIELQNKTFTEIEDELWPLLELPQVKRCCIDATGLGMQLAERAKARFGWKVEPICFTQSMKEELAFTLRCAFEDRTVRIDPDPKLRADLRAIKKEVTSAGHIRFVAESDDGPQGGRHASGHCDRFWAKALRHHAAKHKIRFGAVVID